MAQAIQDGVKAGRGIRGRRMPDEKVQWLVARPELWAHLSDDEVELLWIRNREAYRVIAKEMKAAGLYSATTGLIDMRVGQLIQRAKVAALKAVETNQ